MARRAVNRNSAMVADKRGSHGSAMHWKMRVDSSDAMSHSLARAHTLLPRSLGTAGVLFSYDLHAAAEGDGRMQVLDRSEVARLSAFVPSSPVFNRHNLQEPPVAPAPALDVQGLSNLLTSLQSFLEVPAPLEQALFRQDKTFNEDKFDVIMRSILN